jgi:hypothetical protein
MLSTTTRWPHGRTPAADTGTLPAAPRGVHIASINALDLLHRTVLNAHGAAFHVSGLTLDATTGAIVIDLLDVDEADEPIPGTEVGILSLDGWQVL